MRRDAQGKSIAEVTRFYAHVVLLQPGSCPRLDPCSMRQEEGCLRRIVLQEAAKHLVFAFDGCSCKKLGEEIEEGERCARFERLIDTPFDAGAKSERTQIAGQLGDCHRHFVRTNVPVRLSLEEENVAFFQIRGEQVEPSHDVFQMFIVAAVFDFLTVVAQERALGGEDRLKFFGKLLFQGLFQVCFFDAVLLGEKCV